MPHIMDTYPVRLWMAADVYLLSCVWPTANLCRFYLMFWFRFSAVFKQPPTWNACRRVHFVGNSAPCNRHPPFLLTDCQSSKQLSAQMDKSVFILAPSPISRTRANGQLDWPHWKCVNQSKSIRLREIYEHELMWGSISEIAVRFRMIGLSSFCMWRAECGGFIRKVSTVCRS